MHTGSWSLQHGIGFGRIHLSFVFRPVLLTMPPSLIGFELGTVVVKGLTVKFHDESLHEKAEIRLATSGGYSKVKKGILTSTSAQAEDDDNDYGEAGSETLLRLPILMRYHSALVVNACSKGLLRSSTLAVGTVWLRDLIDNHHDGIVSATLWKGNNFREIKQNYSKPEDISPGVQGEAIGEVKLQVMFKPGISDAHEKDMSGDPNMRRTWEEYVIMKREGLRNTIGRPGAEAGFTLDSDNSRAGEVQQAETKAIDPTEPHGELALFTSFICSH